jgi:DNA polymerase III subunit delta'
MARTPVVQSIEPSPEVDRLDGFPHPRETVHLFGHEAAEADLATAFQSGRIHHAWLISGPEGIGKATLAYRFAAYALANDADRSGTGLGVDREASAARQVRALSHPGLLVLRRPFDLKTKRFPATIPVDEVRRLRGFLGLKGGEATWRAVIVDRADDLNVNAANALLKSLEEPPPRTVFLLVSSAPGRLLTTIRSRCRYLDLGPLAEDSLKKAVTQAMVASGEEISAAAPTPSEWPGLEKLSGGSVRRLLFLHAARGLELHERIANLFASLPKLDWAAIHALGDELASPAAEQKFELFYELLLEFLAVLIREAANTDGQPVGEGAGRLISQHGLATWAGLWERVAADKADAIALNLDRKALILDTFFRIEAAVRAQP